MMCLAVDGRLVVRNLPASASAMVGILEFPPEFVPEEDALYVASLRDGRFCIMDTRVDNGVVPECSGMGINNILRESCWRGVAEDDMLTVRFIEAFPQSNRWTVFGASNKHLMTNAVADQVGQVWLSVCDRKLKQIEPVVSEFGMTLGQMLSSKPVWPDSKGVMHTLPVIESRWRQAYLEYSTLQARYGAKEISKQQLVDAVRADPALFAIRSLSVEDEFCRYLARLRDAGGLTLNRPFSADEVAKKDALIAQLISVGEDADDVGRVAGRSLRL
jgi:hypothetical protein